MPKVPNLKALWDLLMFRPPVPAPAGPIPAPPVADEQTETPSPVPPAPMPVPTPAPAPTAPSVAGKKAIPAAALAIIAATIAVEGGWVNNKSDPGGETNMGITKVTAVQNGYTGPMRTLPRGVAESIYYDQYMVKPGYAPLIALDAPVTEELFDTTANMGVARPSRWFQQSVNTICSLGIPVDGHIGPGTISAYTVCQRHLGATKLCVAMLNSLDGYQLAEYKRLVRVNPNLRVFYKGWTNNRINNVDRRKCSGGPK